MTHTDIGFIIHRHGVLYAQEYGFNDQFDVYVANGLANFVENFNPLKEHIWLAERNSSIIGSVAIVQCEKEIAQLRWLIVEPTERGKGIGKDLVNEAVFFAKTHGYKNFFLWTIDFLDAAKQLYANANFELVTTKKNKVWGKELIEEKWELSF
ncbi:MAG: GNAT family N-acetyltransferase [Desulfobacteraceae bacterium]|nr:GNAT family N-acetyltransferase [Desulfobacteraceae bacterium]